MCSLYLDDITRNTLTLETELEQLEIMFADQEWEELNLILKSAISSKSELPSLCHIGYMFLKSILAEDRIIVIQTDSAMLNGKLCKRKELNEER